MYFITYFITYSREINDATITIKKDLKDVFQHRYCWSVRAYCISINEFIFIIF